MFPSGVVYWYNTIPVTKRASQTKRHRFRRQMVQNTDLQPSAAPLPSLPGTPCHARLKRQEQQHHHQQEKTHSIRKHEQQPQVATRLQLRQHIAGLARVKRPGSDEEDEAGVDIAVPRRHAGPLDHGQQIALHPLRAGVCRPSFPRVADLTRRGERNTRKIYIYGRENTGGVNKRWEKGKGVH